MCWFLPGYPADTWYLPRRCTHLSIVSDHSNTGKIRCLYIHDLLSSYLSPILMFIYPDILYMIRDTGGFSCFKLEILLIILQFTPLCILAYLSVRSVSGALRIILRAGKPRPYGYLPYNIVLFTRQRRKRRSSRTEALPPFPKRQLRQWAHTGTLSTMTESKSTGSRLRKHLRKEPVLHPPERTWAKACRRAWLQSLLRRTASHPQMKQTRCQPSLNRIPGLLS